jgi:hypothetical protein
MTLPTGLWDFTGSQCKIHSSLRDTEGVQALTWSGGAKRAPAAPRYVRNPVAAERLVRLTISAAVRATRTA